MKQHLILPFFLAMALPAGAQQAPSIRDLVSVIAGAGLSTYDYRTPGNRFSGSALLNPEVGFLADFPVTTACYLQPGLFYTEKGGRNRVTGKSLSLSYLELPMDFVFRPELGKGKSFWVGFGPYIAYGFAGRSGTGSDPFHPGQQGGLYRFDTGGHLQIGYQAPFGILVGINEQLGLANIRVDGTNDYAFRNNFFSLFLGYCFTRVRAP